ncbi:hypothetical protein ACQP2T_28075 [Nonomuraea sp. CA-143628]|uniref:hypothetical protein n=1 Tax=Nonomuraea sp. CA-143628 TaxID=3239997 RepID=UPI003D89FAEA
MGGPAREDLRGARRCRPKKLIELCRLLVEQGDELEAELAHRYPRDADQLSEFWAGRMSWRRLWVLVKGCWSTETELLAQNRDLLAYTAWLYACVHRGDGPTPPRPEPIPRPFDN